jgi:hypothetical protein
MRKTVVTVTKRMAVDDVPNRRSYDSTDNLTCKCPLELVSIEVFAWFSACCWLLVACSSWLFSGGVMFTLIQSLSEGSGFSNIPSNLFSDCLVACLQCQKKKGRES